MELAGPCRAIGSGGEVRTMMSRAALAIKNEYVNLDQEMARSMQGWMFHAFDIWFGVSSVFAEGTAQRRRRWIRVSI